MQTSQKPASAYLSAAQGVGFHIITRDYDPSSNMAEYKKYLGEIVKISMQSRADVLQLRIKSLPASSVYELAVYVKKMISGPLFFINDRPDIAYIAGADGVHLGQDDIPLRAAKKAFPGLIYGISAKDLVQAKKAREEGADYIGVGPLYETLSKKDAGTVMTPPTLESICKNIGIPAVGIGGITPSRVKELSRTGLRGVAVISAVSYAKNPLRTAAAFRGEIDKYMMSARKGDII